MSTPFKVELTKFSTITELPNAWSEAQYVALLDVLGYDNISEIPIDEIKQTCLILLSENEPTEAAEIILEYLFKERLNSGQIENIANEMQDEKVWEEYPDLSLHEEFFNATQLLYETYNGKFPHPEAVQFKFTVAGNPDDLSVFKTDRIESAVVRLLANGMPKNTLINRLYHEKLTSKQFEDAENIIWQLQKEEVNANTVTFTIISSSYWFKDLKYIEGFEASTHADEPEDEETEA